MKIKTGTKVLVTGGTGFTGSVLTKKLVALGLEVRVIARESSDISSFNNLSIEWVRGNIFDKEVIQKACKDIEYIFNVAAAYREAKLKEDDYYKVHVSGTELLAKEALKQSKFKRFIHISTIGVHGDIKNPPADEQTSFNPGDIYQNTKALAETWLHSFALKNNLEYTVIRPVAIYGPSDKRLLKLFRMAKKGIYPLLGYGKSLYHLIHVDDLTEIIIKAAISKSAKNEVFIAGNPESVSIEEIGKIVASAYKKKLHIIKLPAWPFFLAGILCELICLPLNIEPPIYRRRVAFYTKDRSFNTSKLRDVLEYKTRYSNEEGLIEVARWYEEHNWL